MDELLTKTIIQYCSPGKELELGLDTWQCNGEKVSGMGFIGGPRTLREFYNKALLDHSTKEFIIFESERYTFKQTFEIVLKLVDLFKNKLNLKQGDRVAICMRNYPEWCFVFIAATYFGAIAVPLNGWWKTEELDYGLHDSGAKLIFCDEERYSLLKPIQQKLKTNLNAQFIVVQRQKEKISVEQGVFLYSDLLKSGVAERGKKELVKDVSTDAVACIMYTSGTTGHPKGVVLTHRGVTNQTRMALLADKLRDAMDSAAGISSNDQPCIICPVPLFHVTASHHIFLASFASGRKFVLMYKWDPEEALKLIQKERPQSWQGVPTMVQDLMEHPDFSMYDTSSLKVVGGGGAPTPRTQVTKVGKKFKQGVPQQGYGLTETNGAICFISGDDYIKKPGSCGKPFPIVELCVVDPDATVTKEMPELIPLKQGERGELLIKSPLVMKEYWNKKGKTDEVIVSVKGKGPGWFRSGDVVELDSENYIHILDRSKDLIIRGGENISCAEVESAVFLHDSVLECAVFGILHERLGEEVGCMIVLKREAKEKYKSGEYTGLVEEIMSLMKDKLASFKIPRRQHFFFQDNVLPRGATGKILKRAVRDEINTKLKETKVNSKL